MHERFFGAHVATADLYSACWFLGGLLGALAATVVAWTRKTLSVATFIGGSLFVVGVLIGARWQFRLEMSGSPMVSPATDLLDGGMRLPFGIALGFGLLGAWCWPTRTPWREVADNSAVVAAVLIAAGRVGCLLNGCCSGFMCPSWLSNVCFRSSWTSEAFADQLRKGLVLPSALASQPAYPLPLLFGAAAVGILLVQAAQVRGRAPAGALAATFGILWPLSTVALEQLRAIPHPPAPLLGATAAVFLATLLGLIVTPPLHSAAAWPTLPRTNVARTSVGRCVAQREGGTR
jgi:phosphatidylglycerol:prolipoprotein diacylglycerol transferase